MRRRHWIVGAILVAIIAAAAGLARLDAGQQTVQAPIFEVDPLWPKPLPNHWLLGSAVGVAIDARDHIFVISLPDSFNTRTEIGAATDPPTGECCLPSPNILEFDAAGTLVSHWAARGGNIQVDGIDVGRAAWPVVNHGIALDPQGNLWIGGAGGTDTHLLKFSRNGRTVVPVGQPTDAAAAAGARGTGVSDTAAGGRRGGRGGRGGGAQAPPALPPNSNATDRFGGAAAVSFDAAANEAFIADGYRNRRVAVVDLTNGTVKRFWGAYGDPPADGPVAPYTPGATPARQFGTPVTCAELAADGMVYICDRSNNRIQVFRKDGTFVQEKIIAPQTRGAGSVWDIAFSRDPQQRYLYVADGMNMKVHILDRQSLDVLTSFGDGGRQPGQFYAVHSIATDSQGNIYTTETYQGKRVQKFVFRGVGTVTRANRGVVWPGR